MIPPANDLGANAWSAAFTFAVAVALFTIGGVWLDRRLGTAFVFTVVGCLIGTAGGFLHLIARLAPGALVRKPRSKSAERNSAEKLP